MSLGLNLFPSVFKGASTSDFTKDLVTLEQRLQYLRRFGTVRITGDTFISKPYWRVTLNLGVQLKGVEFSVNGESEGEKEQAVSSVNPNDAAYDCIIKLQQTFKELGLELPPC